LGQRDLILFKSSLGSQMLKKSYFHTCTSGPNAMIFVIDHLYEM